MSKVIAIGLTSEKLDELLENMKNKVLASLKRLSEQIVRYYKGAKIGKYRITSSHNLLQKIVDSVIMVGGSSNLKVVEKLLTTFFSRDIVHKHTDLQECVGSGVFYSYLSLNNPELITNIIPASPNPSIVQFEKYPNAGIAILSFSFDTIFNISVAIFTSVFTGSYLFSDKCLIA